MKSKIYQYNLKIDYVGGTTDVTAESENEAYEKLMNRIGEALADALPEFDIEYDIELEDVYDEDPDEAYEMEKERYYMD